jgi:hypothetical protein
MKRLILPFLCLFLVSCKALAGGGLTTPAPIPPELSIEEHALQRRPEAEYARLYFVSGTQEGVLSKRADERSRRVSFAGRSCSTGNRPAMCAMLGADQLVAWLDYGVTGFGYVTVTRNGSRVYRTPVGDSSPISPLRGLWVYADHWALETAYVTNQQMGSEINSQAVGQVSIDGMLINDLYGYEEAFGFQTLHGSPFYFFKRDGRIGVSYDGVEEPLGYEEVLHYGCCSASTLNPHVAENMVAFFASRGDMWYYVEIGVFGHSSQ